MKYIIFYNNGNTHNYANSRNDLLKWLELLKSVLEKYIKY